MSDVLYAATLATACLGLAGWALISMGGAPLALVLIGCALYLVGAIGVTIAFNVPLNNRLEKLHSRDAGAAGFWDQYLARPMSYQLAAVDPDAPARVLAEARDAYEGPWNIWNDVRAVLSSLAFVILVGVGLLREDRW